MINSCGQAIRRRNEITDSEIVLFWHALLSDIIIVCRGGDVIYSDINSVTCRCGCQSVKVMRIIKCRARAGLTSGVAALYALPECFVFMMTCVCK